MEEMEEIKKILKNHLKILNDCKGKKGARMAGKLEDWGVPIPDNDFFIETLQDNIFFGFHNNYLGFWEKDLNEYIMCKVKKSGFLYKYDFYDYLYEEGIRESKNLIKRFLKKIEKLEDKKWEKIKKN